MLFFSFIIFLGILSPAAYSLEVTEYHAVPTATGISISLRADALVNVTVLYGKGTFDKVFKESTKKLRHTLSLVGLEQNQRYLVKATLCSENECVTTEQKEILIQDQPLSLRYKIDNGFGLQTQWYEEDATLLLNTKKISVLVAGKPGSEVSLYVNSQLKRFRVMPPAGNDTFTYVDVAHGDVLQLLAKNATHTIEHKVTIQLDLEPPGVTLDALPSLSSKNTLPLTGTVTEPVLLTIKRDGQVLDTIALDQPGAFNKTLRQLPEGKHTLTFLFTDPAGNTVEKQATLEIDTVAMTLSVDTIPATVYVDSVEIKGKTKPGARVVVFVNNLTGPRTDFPTGIVQLLETIGRVVDAKSQYHTIADDQGEFSLRVKLSKSISVESQNIGSLEVHSLSTPEWPNKITVVAIDKLNQIQRKGPYVVTIRTCDSGGDWNFVVERITPHVINPTLLEQGVAYMGIMYRLEWQGLSAEPGTITSVYVQKSNEGSEEQRRHNQYVRRIDRIGAQQAKRNTITLSLGNTGITREELKQLGSLNFLLVAEIAYTYKDVSGQKISARQKKCLPVTIEVDKAVYLDEKIPRKMIQGMSSTLSAISSTIGDAREQLMNVQRLVLYGSFGTKIYEIFARVKAHLDCGSPFKLQVPEVLPSQCPANDESCQQCWNSIIAYEKAKKVNEWVWDRLYCPTIPSFGKFANDEKMRPKPYYYLPGLGEEGSEQASGDVIALENICDFASPPTEETKDNPEYAACREAYLYKYKSVCPLHSNLYDYSFNRSSAGFFDRFLSSMHLCSIADKSKKNYDLVAYYNGCQKHNPQNPDTLHLKPGPCYFLLEQDEQKRVSVYWAQTAVYSEIVSGIAKGEGNTEPPRSLFTDDPDISVVVGKDNREYIVSFFTQEQLLQLKQLPPYSQEREQLREEYKQKAKLTDKELIANGLSSRIAGLDPVLVDPRASLFTSLQCGCLSSTSAYLKTYKGAIDAVNSCFQAILTTGQASAGMCKNVLSVYVCDLIYDAINCAGRSLLVSGLAKENNEEPSGTGV
ncbi:MAG: hypothetical protein QW594_01975, partial [Candidatus Woesearchaeota archaeon]